MPALESLRLIAGVDEAGRGPLAGPVYVAAVVLNPAQPIAGLDDSKKLSAKRRDQLHGLIIERALAYCVIAVSAAEIDQINILQATLAGMSRALRGLTCRVDEALIDGNRLPADLPCPARALIGGDALEACISAASIVAKVERDRHLLALEQRYPGYGFAKHKGYGTREHLDALQRLGPCAEHRRSFAPVRAAMALT
ncbi:MAG: ribonuclease HII [Xanthomonadales bacterium]|nr:ribonuclease HII [Xanthomonadales bacterium]